LIYILSAEQTQVNLFLNDVSAYPDCTVKIDAIIHLRQAEGELSLRKPFIIRINQTGTRDCTSIESQVF
jgi:uncharacterized lipoprotein YmbA